MNFKKLNNLSGWLVFAVAAVVYLITIEDTVSLWDCGEYIRTSYNLEVGHPPGGPTFNMIGRLFSAFVAPENVAQAINSMSAICSAFGVLFIFWIITQMVRRMMKKSEGFTLSEKMVIIGSGALGALTLTFTDTYWFNAVEGEVYAMSSMLTALVIWAIFKWDEEMKAEVTDETLNSNRWVVFIFLVIGLSIGVHLLNLLAIPAMAYIYFFRKMPNKLNLINFILVGLAGVVLLVFVQDFLIPGLPKLADVFEYHAVSSFGMGFNSGAFIFITFLVAAIAFGLWYTRKKNAVVFNTIVWSFTGLIIGYSSFAMILIRSNANPPLDENNPETLSSFVSYLNREQYGSFPVFYGAYFTAPNVIQQDATSPNGYRYKKTKGKANKFKVYTTEFQDKKYTFGEKLDAQVFADQNGLKFEDFKHEYIIENIDPLAKDENGEAYYRNASTVKDPKWKVLFPRLWDGNAPAPKQNAYRAWSGMTNVEAEKNMKDFTFEGTSQVIGQAEKPTMGENFQYFFHYQVNWMYWRYFMWNFAGRSRDKQGNDDNIYDGQWISGIPLVDDARVGNQEFLPSFIKDNKAHNTYFLLPFIFGVIGLLYHFFKNPKDAFVMFLMFFFTGLAIGIYLNMKPMEPRERDYAFIGSFMFFSAWVGMSLYAFYDAAKSFSFAAFKNEFLMVGAVLLGVGFIGSAVMGGSIQTGVVMAVLIFAVFAIVYALQKLISEKSEVGGTALTMLIVALAPILLAVQNWDDHDRSNRYMARDFAMNYLNSCDENAVLFTNGDNDTFPLWYLLGVERKRTDVRVVNLSLLSTDWHTNELKRKSFDSEPVTIGMEEEKYRGSWRNVIIVDPAASLRRNKMPVPATLQRLEPYRNKAISASTAMKIITNDDFSFLADNITGLTEAFLPTNKIEIPVNIDNAVKYGIIKEEERHLVDSTITYTLKGGFMYKADMVVLDILANYNWDRPIYFASPGGMGAHANLGDYLEADGVCYKLTPIKRKDAINTYSLYDKIMNPENDKHFTWGNMADPNVYVDNYAIRMTNSFRMMFYRLGMDLVAKKENEKAIALIDKCMEVMPIEQVPVIDALGQGFTYLSAFSGIYAQAGAQDKADALMAKNVEIWSENLKYFYSLDIRLFMKSKSDIDLGMTVVAQSALALKGAAYKKEVKANYEQIKGYALAQINRLVQENDMLADDAMLNRRNYLSQLSGMFTQYDRFFQTFEVSNDIEDAVKEQEEKTLAEEFGE